MIDNSYYHKNFALLRVLIEALYEVPSCGTGGMCHIILENNVRDSDLLCVLGLCYNSEYKSRTEMPLVKLICELMLEMEYKQRVCLFCLLDVTGYSLESEQCIFDFEYIIESKIINWISEHPNN